MIKRGQGIYINPISELASIINARDIYYVSSNFLNDLNELFKEYIKVSNTNKDAFISVLIRYDSPLYSLYNKLYDDFKEDEYFVEPDIIINSGKTIWTEVVEKRKL